ncbi:MAG: leucine-rich repeat protein, partial [bacterium]|nr:leucine-rich repeat protein [bacterium]
MEYVPGGSLSDKIKAQGKLDIRTAIDITIKIASALDAAHKAGVVHRDVKPDNIMFDADGSPKLSDLGVAKVTGSDDETNVTMTGMILGTPAYMSPEQMMNSHDVDGRADIYSLGMVLYEMLTGRRPNDTSTIVQLLAKAIQGEELPDVRTVRPEVSVAVSYVLSKMVAVKPEARPASAMEVARLLFDAATGRLIVKQDKKMSAPPRKGPVQRGGDAMSRSGEGVNVGGVAKWVVTALGVAALWAAVFFGARSLNAPKKDGKDVTRPMVVTNTIERVVRDTPLVVTNVVERTKLVTNDVERASENATMPDSVYVSRSALHAAYRARDRRRVFVEAVHDMNNGSLKTPPCTLERIKEYIADGAEIIWVRLGLTKDGVLFAVRPWDIQSISDGHGHVSEYTAEQLRKLKVKHGNDYTDAKFVPFEELLRQGRNKVLFKPWYQTGSAKSVFSALVELLNRLGAWESVILEMRGDDPATTREVIGEELWRRLLSGELQTMVGPDRYREWAAVVPECSVWSRSWDLKKIGVAGIPQHIVSYFGWDPGEAGRTDDAVGWTKAINDGVTVFRTQRPRELACFLKQRRISEETQASPQSVKPDAKGSALMPSSAGKARATVVLVPRLDPDPKAWAYSFEWQDGWKNRDFDDSNWKRGRSGFGFRTYQCDFLRFAHIMSDWRSENLFLRRHFKWNGDAGNISRVVADMFVDDAARIYLNGKKVYSWYFSRSYWMPHEIPLEHFASALSPGDNVLCIEAINFGSVGYIDCGIMIECGGKVERNARRQSDGIHKVSTGAGTWTVKIENGVAQIGDGSNVALSPRPFGALEIPSELGGFSIREIANSAFRDCGELTKVNICEGIHMVRPCAFIGCGKLKSVTLPDSLEFIGCEAFCSTALESVDLKNVRLLHGGMGAFENCRDLTKVSVSKDNPVLFSKDGVIYDKQMRAVVFCPRERTSFKIPDGIEQIQESAFQYSRIRSVVIPDTVRCVGRFAWGGCRNLESVEFKGDDALIGGRAFSETPKLKKVVLPRLLKWLDDWSIFDGDPELDDIKIPDTVEIIGAAVFAHCNSLKRISLGKSLKLVRRYAFGECAALESVTFANVPEFQGDYILGRCPNLKAVRFLSGDAPQIDPTFYKDSNPDLVTLVPRGSKGWNGPGSTDLPAKWPLGAGADARRIRYIK